MSTLVALLAWVLPRARQQALGRAERMTGDVADLAMVARLTHNAVALTDEHGQVRWSNPAFQDLAGCSEYGLIGRGLADALCLDREANRAAGDALRRALERGDAFDGEIVLPDIEAGMLHTQVELRRGGLHCEVLLRMLGEGGELISPMRFMPSAERYQLVSQIDRWVLKHVLDALRGLDLAAIERVAINISGQSVADLEFREFAGRAIRDSGVPPSMLAFEITETAAVTNLERASRFIDDCRELGVQIALDDFGAGAASFGYLKELKADVLKIDGQFVKDLLSSPLDESAVRCFTDVARVLGMKTVAEHVEDAATSSRLYEMGVNMAQGYYHHRPVKLSSVLPAPRARTGGLSRAASA